MMKMAEATLSERAGYLYRRLLLLQRLFTASDEEADWTGTGDKRQDMAVRAGIRELLEELTEHARLLTQVPFPLKEWRVGDGPDDERWRALTEIERRELLSMMSGYEDLITWAEDVAQGNGNSPGEAAAAESRTLRRTPLDGRPREYLKAERERLSRVRKDMGFLERRQIGPNGTRPLL
jgi:hypothetical protein